MWYIDISLHVCMQVKSRSPRCCECRILFQKCCFDSCTWKQNTFWLKQQNLMKGSPCCAGLMWSCLHTYRTKTNLTQHIIQPWWGGGASGKYGGGHQPSMGGAISQVWGGHQPTMGGHQPSMGGHQPTMGGGPSAKYGGGHIFPPVCTGSQNPQNYFSNTYVLPSVNRTAGPNSHCLTHPPCDWDVSCGSEGAFVVITS